MAATRWTERDVEGWWEGLTDQQRCWYAAKEAGADGDVLYAIQKPWKYRDEAFAGLWQETPEIVRDQLIAPA